MTKNQIKMALDAMLEQGNQLRASELIPALNKIIDLIPESTGGGGSGVPVVEIDAPVPENPEDFISPAEISFKIPAEKVEIFEKHACVIIVLKQSNESGDEVRQYFMPYYFDGLDRRKISTWYYLEYDFSNVGETSPNVWTLKRINDNMYLSLKVKSTLVVNFVADQEPDEFTGHIVSSTKAVYNEIHKTK